MSTELIPAGIAEGSDEVGALWERLSHTDWNSNAAAYATAVDARRIMAMAGTNQKAFAAECKTRRIAGFGSQASVRRRIRWAKLHETLWRALVLPEQVFIPESVLRPLFDGKIARAEHLALVAELFGPYLSAEERRSVGQLDRGRHVGPSGTARPRDQL